MTRSDHPKPWHRNSTFGDGPRVPLDRNGRARFAFLLRHHRQHGRLTADHREVGDVLLSALGADGQLDLAHATIAARAGCHVATVKRALGRLRALGLVQWTLRLVRDAASSWRCEQASSAYVLVPSPCGAQAAPQVGLIDKKKALSGGNVQQPVHQFTAAEITAAREALARRRAAVEARLLTGRMVARA